MRLRLLILTTSLAATWLTATGAAAPSDPLGAPDALLQLGEASGQTMAIVLSMYWLRDSYLRRIEECQRYADAVLALKQESREEYARLYERSLVEANRYAAGFESLLKRILDGTGSKATAPGLDDAKTSHSSARRKDRESHE